jgi:hypothetical protein
VKKKLFGRLELEMAHLERFWRKTPLGPLGVNTIEKNCRPWGLGGLCAVVYAIGGFKPLLKRFIH